MQTPSGVQALTLVLVIAMWEIIGRTGILFDELFPPMVEILQSLWRFVTTPLLLPHLDDSLSRALIWGSALDAVSDSWDLPAPVADVAAVLTDLEHYPAWWAQVVAVARIDDEVTAFLEAGGAALFLAHSPVDIPTAVTTVPKDSGFGEDAM